MRTRDKERAAKNIMRVFDQATDDEIADGLGWYKEAWELAHWLEPGNEERSAAVIAVLSPRLSWNKNVELARRAYALAEAFHGSRWASQTTPTWSLACLTANATKARQLLVNGEDPNDVVSGPKVRAFWRAIVDPSDPRAIVVDRHALDVAFGKVMDDRTRGQLLGKKGAYDEVAQRYVYAAELIGNQLATNITPVQVQAVTWVTWRRLKKEGSL